MKSVNRLFLGRLTIWKSKWKYFCVGGIGAVGKDMVSCGNQFFKMRFAHGLWLPNVLKRVRFLFSLHCTYKSPMRKAEKLTTGHHLSWDGKVAAEQPDRLYNRTRHTCG